MGLTKRQLAMRKHGVGASEISALAGLSRWATPIQIYEAKTTDISKEPTLAMSLGNMLEEPVARIYQARTGLFPLRCDTLVHPKHPIALATPDRLIFKERVRRAEAQLANADRLLQVKTTSWRHRDEWGREGTDEIPEYYLAQVQWEMMVSGVPRCDVAVLIDRDDFLIYSVAHDAELTDGLLAVAERFWADHVVPRKPPPPDASDAYREFLGRRFPRHANEVLLPADPNVEALAAVLRESEAKQKEAESLIEATKNEIKLFIGDAAGVQGGFGKITWKANKPSQVVDWQAAFYAATKLVPLNEVNAAITQHTTERPGARVLRKKWNGDNND